MGRVGVRVGVFHKYDGIRSQIFKNNYKKLDKSTQKEIDTILNRKVNIEKNHYTNIKEVLNKIKDKTGGYINYFIILGIKK